MPLGIWEALQIEATSAERKLRAEACEAVANGDRSLLDGHADAALRHYDEATPVAANRLQIITNMLCLMCCD